MEAVSEPQYYRFTKAERYYQRGRYGFAPFYSAVAEVKGLIRKRSPLWQKEHPDGKKTYFMVLTVDCGPIYKGTTDGGRGDFHNVIDVWFFDGLARKLLTVLEDYHEKVRSAPYIIVSGTIETRFEWIDKEDLSKGRRATGQMGVRAKRFWLPPVPKLREYRGDLLEEDFPDAPVIRV